MNEFAKIRDMAAQVKDRLGVLNDVRDEIEQIYFMEWSDEERVKAKHKNVKVTKSPDGRNQTDGAHRLLVSTEPEWSVPKDRNDDAAQKASEPLEQFAERMYKAACAVSGVDAHEDAALSLLLHDVAHLSIISTADLVKYARKRVESLEKGAEGYALAQAQLERAEAIQKRTPYLFEGFDAKGAYPVWDRMGLAAHYRETDTTLRAIQGDWGLGDGIPDGDLTDEYVLCEWWDIVEHCVWIEGEDTPILHDEHGLGFIPIVVEIAYGRRNLFRGKPEYQYQPFLWTLNQSGMWDRQNLLWTVSSTNLFAIGANAIFIHRTGDPDKDLDVDWSVVGGRVVLEPDESLEQLQVRPIHPDLMQMLSATEQKMEQSTMYGQALGQPLGGNASFSEVSLLSQSGRLPLLPVKNALGRLMGNAMQICFRWMKKEEGVKIKAQYGELMAELKRADIPDHVEIEAIMEVSLPQDKLQNANVADRMTKAPEGQEPLTSNRWARENVLGIGQSNEMTKEIMKEQATGAMFQFFMQEMLPAIMQKMAGGPPVPTNGGGGAFPAANPAGMAGAGMEAQPRAGGSPMDGNLPQVMEQGPAMPGETPGEQQMGPPVDGEMEVPGMV